MFKFKMWPVLATGFLLLSVGSYAIADSEYGYKFGPIADSEYGYKFGPIADNEDGHKPGSIADNEDGHKPGSMLCRVIHGSMFLFASRTRASSSVGRALSSVISRSIHDATPRSAHAHDQD
jgi:hypothetical protein